MFYIHSAGFSTKIYMHRQSYVKSKYVTLYSRQHAVFTCKILRRAIFSQNCKPRRMSITTTLPNILNKSEFYNCFPVTNFHNENQVLDSKMNDSAILCVQVINSSNVSTLQTPTDCKCYIFFFVGSIKSSKIRLLHLQSKALSNTNNS